MNGWLHPAAVLAGLLMLAGCTSARMTHTDRTAKEQLLISNSVDQALNKIDFHPFAGQEVYLEEKYLDGTDKNYVVASVRHRLLHAGAALKPKAEEAQIIVEIRSGGIGTDSQETFFGTPELQVPVPAVPVAIPEVKLVSRDRQTATAKIGIVAYDAKTGQILGSGGTTLARSDSNNWFVLGAGPYQRGTIHEEYERQTAPAPTPGALPPRVVFAPPEPAGKAEVRWAADSDEKSRTAGEGVTR